MMLTLLANDDVKVDDLIPYVVDHSVVSCQICHPRTLLVVIVEKKYQIHRKTRPRHDLEETSFRKYRAAATDE